MLYPFLEAALDVNVLSSAVTPQSRTVTEGAAPLPSAAFPAQTAARLHRAVLGLSVLCLAVAYSLLAARLNRYHSLWSADSGALLAMVQSQRAGHGPALLAYDNAALDPTGQIHPLAFFVRSGPRGLFLEFPPLFPWLSALAMRAFSFSGLTLLPMICGLGTALTTALTARRLGLPGWFLLPLVMGLATPLVLYSVVFWHHTPLMLAAALAGLLLLRALQAGEEGEAAGKTASLRLAVLAGMTLGVGMWLHELLLLLFVAVFATLPFLPRSLCRGRLVWGLLAGFLPCLLLWTLANRLLYGLWGGPHVAGNVASLQRHLSGWQAVLDPSHLEQRVWLQLIGAESSSPRALCVAALLVGVVLASWLARRWPAFAPWLAEAACLLAAFVSLSLLPDAVPFSGLFAATPLLIPALLLVPLPKRLGVRRQREPAPSPNPANPPASEAFIAWMGRACALFVLLVLVNPIQPGMDWGSRYLLTVLPWLVLLSRWAWRQLAQEPARHGRIAAPVVLATLVALSLSAQLRGLAAVRQDLIFSRALIDVARAQPGPVLVTDLAWLGPELTASPTPPPPQFLVRGDDDRRLLLATLRARSPAGFTYMGSFEGLAPLAHALRHADPPLRVKGVGEGAGLRLAQFAPSPSAAQARIKGSPQAPPAAKIAPRVLALYYPWYATPTVSGHWTHQDGVDIAHKRIASHTHYPALGPYDSADPAVLDRHLAQAKAAGIDTLVCSWWGPGDMTDANLHRLLARAPAFGLTVCAYWEHPSHPGDPKATEEDLASLLTAVGQEPGYLKVGGKPVVFLYAQTCRTLAMGQWVTLLHDIAKRFPPGALTIGNGLGAGDLAIDDLLVWDGWHTLEAPGPFPLPQNKATRQAAAQQQRDLFALPLGQARYLHSLFVETVMPGFDERRPNAAAGRPPGAVLDRQGGALYRALWEQAIQDKPDWVLINSFNEWHNGTEIEPSAEEGDRFLTLTRAEADRFKGRAAAP